MDASRAELAPAVNARADLSGAASDAELVALWLATRRSPLTRKRYAQALAWWRVRLGPLALGELRLAHLRDALATAPSSAPATERLRIAALRSLLTFGHARVGYLALNVGAVLLSPERADDLAERILDPEQVLALLAAAATAPRVGVRDHAIVRVLYVSGCRVAELVGLDWLHVHERDDGRAALTLHGKRGKTRHVLITAGTTRELVALRPELALPSSPVFRATTGERLDVRDVHRLVERAGRRAKLGARASPHWLRHAHASHALDRGAPVHLVAADLGHASVATTTRYLHARPGSGSSEFLGL